MIEQLQSCPLKYFIVWSLTIFFVFFSFVIFILTFYFRIKQSHTQKIQNKWNLKIRTFFAQMLLENEISADEIFENAQIYFDKKWLNSTSFKQFFFQKTVNLYDTLEGASKENIKKIIETLVQKSIVQFDLKNKNESTQLMILNNYQILSLKGVDFGQFKVSRLVKNKISELYFTNYSYDVSKAIIHTDWQKTNIIYYLKRFAKESLPDFFEVYQQSSTESQKIFAIQLIGHFRQYENIQNLNSELLKLRNKNLKFFNICNQILETLSYLNSMKS
ncbi:MAG: hypothetical protein KA313_05745 [Pseudarcicella sp.]|nr:hypothetical protein [Pseudarcicella sp.]MBP6410584.1 hypothetical protein [Pseudarcicella sp.]